MPSRAYHEAVWKAVPPGTRPPDFAQRLDFLLSHVRPGDRVLDVGCGEGWFMEELVGVSAAVVGVDVANEPLRRARERDPSLDLRLIDPDAGQWLLEDASFDVVWAGETIEHVPDTAGWLSEVRRVLRPEGLLLLSTPDHGLLRRLWLACSRRAFQAHFDPLGDHFHYYTRAGLIRLLREFGFRGLDVRGCAGAPGSRRLLLARAVRARW